MRSHFGSSLVLTFWHLALLICALIFRWAIVSAEEVLAKTSQSPTNPSLPRHMSWH